MGLFKFIEKVATGTVKIVLTPVTIVKDIVEGTPFNSTTKIASSGLEDILDSPEKLYEDE